MANNNSSITPTENTTPKVHIINGREWREAVDLAHVWHFRLECPATRQSVGFPTEQRRVDFIGIWRAIEEPLTDLEAISEVKS